MVNRNARLPGWTGLSLLRQFYSRWMPALLACVCLGLLGVYGGWVEKPALDTFLRMTAPALPEKSPVVLVLIDDESIARLRSDYGPPPWRHMALFRAIQRYEPALIVFDGHFMDIRYGEDSGFFDQLKTFPNLVTGLLDSEILPGDRTGHDLKPAFENLALGMVNVHEDADGVVRSLQPFVTNRLGVYLNLGTEAAVAYRNQTQPGSGWYVSVADHPDPAHPLLQMASEHNPETGYTLPLIHQRLLPLRWYRLNAASTPAMQFSHPALPLWRVTDPAYSATVAAALQGKLVLIGSASALTRDFHKTPMATHHLGADIQATAIDNLLWRDTWRFCPQWLSLLLLLGMGGLAWALRWLNRQPGNAILYTVGCGVVYAWLAAVVLFGMAGIKVPVAGPLLMLLLGFMGASLQLNIRGDITVRNLEASLRRLVSRDVYAQIRNMPEGLAAGGQRMDITVLMIDIRNFTQLAEARSAQEVTDLLNEFYSAMVSVIFRHNGTVDKFLGDGILTLFGAPLPSQTHPQQAVQAAIEMTRIADRLTQRWSRQFGIETGVGVSICSGPAIVGFVGPPDKLEYTAIGDTVNVASRLQPYARHTGSGIVLAAATAETVLDDYPSLRKLESVTLRGRTQPVDIYTLDP
ncbi:MAG: CHASE2 domain-containing protein [Candidatus Melainabacteria bacterium]